MTHASSLEQANGGAPSDSNHALLPSSQPFDHSPRPAETITAHIITGAAAGRRRKQELVGSSPATKELISAALEAASVNWSLLITGETGTGKTTIASFIHESSPRAHHPFIAVNCAAIPKDLVESELFGHVRGAFTGAVSDKEGAFERAQGGTLFFDEIGDLSLEAQAKLLTAIEQKTFARVGSHKLVMVDVRVITATHRNIEEMMEAGTFRRDLYQRISFLEIEAPALCARADDIPALAKHLVSRCAHELELLTMELDEQVTAWLTRQTFPGNVRDLHRTVSKLTLAAARDRSDRIEMSHALKVQKTTPSVNASNQGRAPMQFIELREGEDLKHANARIELAIIQETLRKCDNNITATSKRLGLVRKYVPTKLKLLQQQVNLTPGSEVTVSIC